MAKKEKEILYIIELTDINGNNHKFVEQSFPTIIAALYENKLLKEKDYFEHLKKSAENLILSGRPYELKRCQDKDDSSLVSTKDTWIQFNERNIFNQECFIEDKYNLKDILRIIENYSLVSKYRIEYPFLNTNIREEIKSGNF